jgi:hypothetical protein
LNYEASYASIDLKGKKPNTSFVLRYTIRWFKIKASQFFTSTVTSLLGTQVRDFFVIFGNLQNFFCKLYYWEIFLSETLDSQMKKNCDL